MEFTTDILSVFDKKWALITAGTEDSFNTMTITKGYPFAYQALGKYLWEEKSHALNDEILVKFDEALRHYVYEKIWSELSPKD